MAADITNNNTTIRGILTDDFVLSHVARGEEFYISELAVPRASGIQDFIPITVSGRLIDVSQLKMGDCLEVQGQIRSLRKRELSKFPIYLFAREIRMADVPESFWINEAYLCGTILSKRELHATLSGREAINIKLLIDRNYGRTDCISCVLWGRNARYADSLDIGDLVSISGRVQSRVLRQATKNENEKRCIEVSVSQIEKGNLNDTDKTPA